MGDRASLSDSVPVRHSPGWTHPFRLGARSDISSSVGPTVNATIVATLAVALTLTLTTRWPAALALTAFAACTVFGTLDNPLVPIWGAAPNIVFGFVTIGAGWWLALACDGRRAVSPTTAVLLLGGSVAFAYLTNNPHVVFNQLGLHAALLTVGLLSVSIDPRPSVFLGCLIALTILPWLPLMTSDAPLTQTAATLATPLAIIAASLAMGHRSTTLHTRTI